MRAISKNFYQTIIIVTLILLLTLGIFILVDDEYSALIVGSKKEYRKEVEMTDCPRYLIYGTFKYGSPYDEYVLMMNVWEMELERELASKIEQNIHHHTLGWLPEEFIGMEYAGAYVMLDTDEYVSLRNDYRLVEQEEDEFIPICVTADMQTGEIVYLDDLVVVDEELAERILQEGFVRSDLIRDNPKDKYALTREELTAYDVNSIMERLELCSQPYDAEHYLDKPSFYLRHGRLYLCNVFSGEPDLYIELEQIEDKLKCGQSW